MRIVVCVLASFRLSRRIVTTVVSLKGGFMQTIQLRDAKAKLSSLVEEAANGETTVITVHGEPRAVLLGVEEWDRLRTLPSFGRLLSSVPLDDGDLPARDMSPSETDRG